MRQGVRLRHVRLSPRDARVTTPKYRTSGVLLPGLLVSEDVPSLPRLP